MKNYLKLDATPRKPYKSFTDFLMKNAVTEKGIKCSRCDGTGRAHRFEDNDPIEGYKLAEKYACSTCDGNGYLDMDTALKIYRAKIVEWKNMSQKTLEKNNMKKIINQKLMVANITTDDWTFIRMEI